MKEIENIALFNTLSEKDVKLLNPLIWAYIGDAIYEAYVRTYIISKGAKSSHKLHIESIKFVKAANQAKILDKLNPYLTEEELGVVRRGRNTKTYHVPKNADVLDYRMATALEALFGYLFLLHRNDRIDEIFKIIFGFEELENVNR